MFSVGEFSQLAQVSKRLLRYYDEIGLLKPAHIDPATLRRSYSAEQLPALNRILALKDLGLSLDQIRRMLGDAVSTDELQGMLLLKKAEIEQQLQGEFQRIRNIEARLQYLRDAESNRPLDVIIKQIPAQSVLSVRAVVESQEGGLEICAQVMTALPEISGYGRFFAILHSEVDDEASIDMEFGRMITASSHAPVPLPDGLRLQFRELRAAPCMATYVVRGWNESILTGYSAIGLWAERNGYRFAGAPREIALHMPENADSSDTVAEIQFPVEPIDPI
ncbi:MAG: MerR family transcriptional regulator [Chloroflexota bacterium]